MFPQDSIVFSPVRYYFALSRAVLMEICCSGKIYLIYMLLFTIKSPGYSKENQPIKLALSLSSLLNYLLSKSRVNTYRRLLIDRLIVKIIIMIVTLALTFWTPT